MLRAFALYVALMISVVVALICGSLLTLYYLNDKEYYLVETDRRLRNNVESAFNWVRPSLWSAIFGRLHSSAPAAAATTASSSVQSTCSTHAVLLNVSRRVAWHQHASTVATTLILIGASNEKIEKLFNLLMKKFQFTIKI